MRISHILPPVHPGEILCEEYLLPLNMGAGALAKKFNFLLTRVRPSSPTTTSSYSAGEAGGANALPTTWSVGASLPATLRSTHVVNPE